MLKSKKKFALTECTCEYTFIPKSSVVGTFHEISTFSKVLYDVSEIESEFTNVSTKELILISTKTLIKDRAEDALLEQCRSLDPIQQKKSEREVEHKFYGVSNCDTRIVYQNTTDD